MGDESNKKKNSLYIVTYFNGDYGGLSPVNPAFILLKNTI